MKITKPDRLAVLSTEIREHEQAANADIQSALSHKIQIGKRLLEAKELLPHGEFLPWAKREFGWSQQHCHRHMQLSRNHTRVCDLPADASFRAVLAAITETREDRRKPESEQSLEVVPTSADGVQLIESSVADLGTRLVPDSVDAIITDPPYSEDYLEVYDDLGQLAAHVLKPTGILLAMVGQYHLPTVIATLGKYLQYHWALAYLTPGGQAPQIWPRHVNTFWKPVLWYTKNGYEGPWIGDVIHSDANDNDKRFHDWGQSESGMARLIEKFTKPGDLILDPFLGGGTTGMVATNLGRRFIGADMDAKAIAITSQRLLAVIGNGSQAGT